LEYRPFITDRIVLIVPGDHPWAQRSGPLRPGDLVSGRFIMREESSGTIEALREGLAWHDLSLDDLDTGMVLGNSEAIRMAVHEGIGVAFVSTMVVSDAVKGDGIAVVEVAGLDLTTTLYMARSSDRPATPAQAAFWDLAFAPESEAIRERPSLPASP
jgi:DNA-binding transcriptional LysR family regulator